MVQGRVLRNSARILRAAADALAADGWAAVSPNAVSRRTGLSSRAVMTRYPTRADIGVAAWSAHAEPTLRSALVDVLTCSGLLDEEGSETAFLSAMESAVRPSGDLLAAVELLVLA